MPDLTAPQVTQQQDTTLISTNKTRLLLCYAKRRFLLSFLYHFTREFCGKHATVHSSYKKKAIYKSKNIFNPRWILQYEGKLPPEHRT